MHPLGSSLVQYFRDVALQTYAHSGRSIMLYDLVRDVITQNIRILTAKANLRKLSCGESTMVLNCAAAAIMMLQALAAPGMERKASELGSNFGSLRLGKGILFCSHNFVRIAVLLVMRSESWMIVEAMGSSSGRRPDNAAGNNKRDNSD